MVRRLATLLLTAVLAFAGLAVGPCPDGRCAMSQAGAKDCCPRDGWTKPSCCPPAEQVGQRSVPPAAERPAPALAVAAAPAMAMTPVLLVPVQALTAPPDVAGPAPPATLIAQHTSLLL